MVDEFLWNVRDTLRRVDDWIREFNRIAAMHPGVYASIPPMGETVFNWLVGFNPKADEHSLLELSSYWVDQASRSGDAIAELQDAVSGVHASWVSDGASIEFHEQASQALDSAMGLWQTETDLAMKTTDFVMTVVQARSAYRAQVVMLLFELIAAIIWAAFTFGVSLATYLGGLAARIAAMRVVVTNILKKLFNVVIRPAFKAIGRVGGRLTPAPVRGLPPAVRRVANGEPPPVCRRLPNQV